MSSKEHLHTDLRFGDLILLWLACLFSYGENRFLLGRIIAYLIFKYYLF